jgi:biotin carboxyl carrier protein
LEQRESGHDSLTANIPLFDRNQSGVAAARERAIGAAMRVETVRLDAIALHRSALAQVHASEKRLLAAEQERQRLKKHIVWGASAMRLARLRWSNYSPFAAACLKPRPSLSTPAWHAYAHWLPYQRLKAESHLRNTMMEQQRRPLNWPLTAGLVTVAAALGFGTSHLMNSKKAPPTATATVAPTAANNAASAQAEGAAPEIKIPAEYLGIAKIAVEVVTSGSPEAEILATGTVTAPPNSEAIIVARASGNISRINRQLGDSVRAGEVLAQVDSMEATTMAADRSATYAKVELARKSFNREFALFQQGVTPRQDMESAQAALAVAESEAQRALAVARAAQVSADGKSVAVVSPIAGKITSFAGCWADLYNRRLNCSALRV